MSTKQIVFPEERLPIKLTPNPDEPMSDDEFFDFCAANPDIRFERTAQGEIVIVPPADFESDYRNVDVVAQLRTWAKIDERGRASGPSTAFILPTRATLSPDAAWVSNSQLLELAKPQLKKFLPLCPEFIVEVMSPSDRLNAAQQKMRDWLAGGIQLGWLIDGDNQTVYIYRASQPEPEKRSGIPKLAGEGPIAGFELDLTDIWAGL